MGHSTNSLKKNVDIDFLKTRLEQFEIKPEMFRPKIKGEQNS